MVLGPNRDDLESCRSFGTEQALRSELTRLGLEEVRHLVVCNRAGGFTAVFSGRALEAHGVPAATLTGTFPVL